MKALISLSHLLGAAGALAFWAVSSSLAGDTSQSTTVQPLILSGPQTTATTAATATTVSVGEAAPVRLPYGVDEVLKLNNAHISEDIIVNYVQNTGTAYNLGPNDIVYLKNQGVSDRVVNAMLDERKRVAAEASAQMAAQSASAPLNSSAVYAQAPTYAPSYDQAPPADVQTAPSTVYVVPSAPEAYQYPVPSGPDIYPYYGYSYPYYYGGYCYGGPVISLGFGFGGRFHGGGFRGGFHEGGGFHGGFRSAGGFHSGGGGGFHGGGHR